jgi:hypothetical protein
MLSQHLLYMLLHQTLRVVLTVEEIIIPVLILFNIIHFYHLHLHHYHHDSHLPVFLDKLLLLPVWI